MKNTLELQDHTSRERAFAPHDAARTWVRSYAFPLTVFVVLRVWTAIWASVAAANVPPPPEALKQYFGVEPLRDVLISPWQRWDTIWCTKVAMEGYTANKSVDYAPRYAYVI